MKKSLPLRIALWVALMLGAIMFLGPRSLSTADADTTIRT